MPKFLDVTDTVAAKAAINADYYVVNVKDYGATGDGVTNDSAAVQAAYDAVAEEIGTPGVYGQGRYGTLLFPSGTYKLTDGLAASHSHVNLRGEGATISGGEVVVGRNSYVSNALNLYTGTTISGFTFDRDDSYGTTRQLVLANCRGLTIKDCYFYRAGKGISAEYTDGNTQFHTLSMIRITNCRFAGMAYGIYANTILWTVCSDWHIEGCFFNFCSVTSVWMWCSNGINIGGVDGLTFTGNTIFSPTYASNLSQWNTLEHNIKIGTSNWVAITGNNLFDPGLSSIYLKAANNTTITGNHFANPGGRVAGDAIEVHGAASPHAVISGNTFSGWTRAAIGLYELTSAEGIVIGPNSYNFSSPPSTWHGVGTVDLTTTYRIYQDGTVGDSVGNPIVRESAESAGRLPPDSIRGSSRITARHRLNELCGVSGSQNKSVSVTAATTVFTIADIKDATGPFGGLAVITATYSTGTNSATYLLFLEGSGASAGTVTNIVSSGLLTGGSSSWPSFTWTISGNSLIATPVGSTGNTFNFHAVALGSLTLT